MPPDATCRTLNITAFPNYQADGLIEDYVQYMREGATKFAFGVEDVIGNPLGLLMISLVITHSPFLAV